MPSIHVCLVSNQLLANLIPAYSDPDIKGVVLFTGDGNLNKQARRLTELFAKKAIPVVKKVNAKNSFDFDILSKEAEHVKEYLQKNYATFTWKINVTGGTKPMSIAVHQCFANSEQAQVIYQDTQNRLLRTMTPSLPDLPNRSVIDLESYLQAHNFIMTHNPATDHSTIELMKSRKHVINDIYVRNINRIWMLSSVLNFPASTAGDIYKNNPLTQKLNPKTKIHKDAIPLLNKLANEGFFNIDYHDKKIVFSSKEAARFIGGGWLEEYAYWCAVDAGIEYIGLNVEGYWNNNVNNKENTSANEAEEATNEFDLLLCHHNHLLVVECKALSFGRQINGQEIINKIDALGKRLGGLFGKSMLLASDRLKGRGDHTVDQHEHIIKRIQSYQLELVEGSEFKTLTERFNNWRLKCEPKSTS